MGRCIYIVQFNSLMMIVHMPGDLLRTCETVPVAKWIVFSTSYTVGQGFNFLLGGSAC